MLSLLAHHTDHTTYKFPVYDKHLPELRAAIEAHLKFVIDKWTELETLEARKLVVLKDHLGYFLVAIFVLNKKNVNNMQKTPEVLEASTPTNGRKLLNGSKPRRLTCFAVK